ncbi:DUF1684 domain-containing protein [Streptacidiphilus neutrinimicus]|uniref:DUF1684 domain-containing protein n=1 Tax=Streptacidiphilus neutrinimicus TaxID=105420 RepID=UPI0005A65C89|nr:DUF1684 domain-containing protein [Streptacidiphilus neutrinimicus]
MDAATEAWKHWRDERVVSARALYGPLSLTGTHWLDEPARDGWALPGRWTVDRAAGKVSLTAARHDGVSVDDVPLCATVRLCPDDCPDCPNVLRITHGGRRLQLIVREDRYAVRVFDPSAPARTAFAGIDAYPYDPDWARPATFVPFPADRTVTVSHSDGHRRPVQLAGTLTFGRESAIYRLDVQRTVQGGLSVSVGDPSRDAEPCGFRVVDIPEPDRTGRTVLDFNRAQLPPSAFAEHYLCPLPTVGNALPFPVPAGERAILKARGLVLR